MTGIGAYFYIVWGIWLRHALNRQEYDLSWPTILFSLPEVVKISATPVRMAADHSSKKSF